MKRYVSMTLALLLATRLIAEADVPVFGNSTNGSDGFNIAVANTSFNTGAAVEFTPLENMSVSSVTLWLSGYSGTSGQTMYANIYNNFNGTVPFGTATNTPYDLVLSFSSSPAPNDGSLAAFTFSDPTAPPFNPSGSTVLLANTPYWLVLDSEDQTSFVQADWVGGEVPTGDAVYDGSIVYDYLPTTNLNPSSIIPAFTINVPEPGFAALMSIPLVFGIGRGIFKRRTSRS